MQWTSDYIQQHLTVATRIKANKDFDDFHQNVQKVVDEVKLTLLAVLSSDLIEQIHRKNHRQGQVRKKPLSRGVKTLALQSLNVCKYCNKQQGFPHKKCSSSMGPDRRCGSWLQNEECCFALSPACICCFLKEIGNHEFCGRKRYAGS